MPAPVTKTDCKVQSFRRYVDPPIASFIADEAYDSDDADADPIAARLTLKLTLTVRHELTKLRLCKVLVALALNLRHDVKHE